MKLSGRHLQARPRLSTPIRIRRLCWLAVAAWASSHALVHERARGAPPEVRPAAIEPADRGELAMFESRHFAIRFDTAESKVRELAERLERTYDAVVRFARARELAIRRPDAPLGVVFLDRYEDYQRHVRSLGVVSELAAGIYDPRLNVAAFCNAEHMPELERIARAVETPPDSPMDGIARSGIEDRYRRLLAEFQQTVVQHEAAHAVMFNVGILASGVDHPSWLVEGLACLFESAADASRPGELPVNVLRLADLAVDLGCGLSAAGSALDLVPAAYDGRMLSWRELVGGADLMSANDDWTRFRYAQAWSWVEFLVRTRGEAFGRFLRLESQRRPGDPRTAQQLVDEFTSSLGPLDDALEREWFEFVFDLHVRPQPRP